MKAKELLGAQGSKSTHIPAMPWREVPVLFAALDEGGITEMALQLLILSACRTTEVRAASWAEIDTEAALWTIPAERMKTGKEHRVPLSGPALAVLDKLKPLERGGWIFPSARKGHLSDMAMSMLMRRAALAARPHGFRSSFRDWCAEATDTPREVAEACPAHIVGSEVERAYRRTDFLERHRVLMERWAEHVTGKGGAEVVRIHG